MVRRQEDPVEPKDGEYTLGQALQIALGNQKMGDFGRAESLYTQIIASFPKSPDALNFYGVLCYQTGRSEEGANLIRQAVTLDPEYVDAWNNLGNILLTLDQFEEAAKAYRRVIRTQPDHANALSNLGLTSKHQKDLAKAAKYYQRALDAQPDHCEANRNMGNLLLHQGHKEAAIERFKKALALNPQDAGTYRAFGRAYRLAGNIPEAINIYRQWLEFEPESPTARHQLAALSREQVPERASPEYVVEEFDGFAESFDKVLLRLKYRAPELCEAAIDRELVAADGSLSILDAGCGTGLCGSFLRPRARRLVGVDISTKMVARAHLTGHYDELLTQDLFEYLPGAGPFDLVVSADTFCYFGELDRLVTGIVDTMTSDGLLVFTVEAGDDDGPRYELQEHGRYRHAKPGIEATLTAAGLTCRGIEPCELRMEGGVAAEGYVVTARRVG